VYICAAVAAVITMHHVGLFLISVKVFFLKEWCCPDIKFGQLTYDVIATNLSYHKVDAFQEQR